MPRLMLAKSRTACVVCRELSSGLELAVSCRIQGVRVTILERPLKAHVVLYGQCCQSLPFSGS